MRRTACALSAAVLAGAALGAFAGPVAADPGVPPPPAEPGVPPPPAEPGEPVAPPSAADQLAGEASARVSPADVAPGETVTVSVSCGPAGGTAPATLDASSAAFDGGTVALRRVTGDEATASGPSYRGTARIAPAEDLGTEQGATDPADPADPAGLPGAAGPVAPAGPDGPVTPADRAAPEVPADRAISAVPAAPVALAAPKTSADADGPAGPADRRAPEIPEDSAVTDDLAGPANPEVAAGGEGGADDWTVDGACPDASGGEGDPWSATMTMPEEGGAGEPGCRESTAPRSGASSHGTPCATTKPPCPEPVAPRGEPSAPGKPCRGGTAEHGVQAGAGGSLSGSVPALVAGGVLIAGACGAAAHRLRLRLRGEHGER
ncbi:hypothetical protein ACWEWP_20395 [Streptomyces olivaceus]